VAFTGAVAWFTKLTNALRYTVGGTLVDATLTLGTGPVKCRSLIVNGPGALTETPGPVGLFRYAVSPKP